MGEKKSITVPGYESAITDVGFHKINVRGYPLTDIIRKLTFTETVFLTIRGELPTETQKRVMDAVLCGIVDHGMFAPTSLATRVVASAAPDSIMPGVAAGMLTVGAVTVSPQDTAIVIQEGLKMMKDEGLNREEAARKFIADPPEINDIVEGLVESVDDLKGEVIINIGGRLGHLPMKGMKWARKPNPKIPYFAAYVKKPGNVLRKGDVVLVRIKDKQKEDQPINQELANNYDWQLSLEQEPKVQGALFCMEAETGRVKSMIGGRDFSISQFNRATQSRRQPGSAFKPIIYAAALDWGMTPVSVIIDSPFISKMNSKNKIWKPKNYKERFYGPTLLRTGLIKSRNVITVKILKKIGVGIAIKYAKKMGIESDLTPNLSLALGSSGLSLAEITRAYSVFANGGGLVELIFINRIEDRNDQIIEENQPVVRESISRETAFVMTDLLKAVIREGTGWRVKELKGLRQEKQGLQMISEMHGSWALPPGLSLVYGLVMTIGVRWEKRRQVQEQQAQYGYILCPMY